MGKQVIEGHSRPAMDRLHQIHLMLQNSEYPNSTALARQFEVSTRTVKRDIDFMRVRMNLPIEYHREQNGYYYTRVVDQFPQMPLSESEIFALLIAQKAVAQYSGTPFEKPLQHAFQRLSGQLDRSVRFTGGSINEALSFRPLAPGDADLQTFELVTTALREHRTVEFHYRNRGENVPRRRVVRPYHLACVQNVWYLLALDEEKKEMRTFALSRVNKAFMTQQKFEPPSSFDPNEYLSGSFGVFKGKDDYEVVLEFDAWAADEVRGRRWHGTQDLQELSRGAVRLRLRLNNLEEVEKWVLSMGTHATVIRPKTLADRVRKVAETLLARYNDQKD